MLKHPLPLEMTGKELVEEHQGRRFEPTWEAWVQSVHRNLPKYAECLALTEVLNAPGAAVNIISSGVRNALLAVHAPSQGLRDHYNGQADAFASALFFVSDLPADDELELVQFYLGAMLASALLLAEAWA